MTQKVSQIPTAAAAAHAAGPVEFRFYLTAFTLDNVREGMNPIRSQGPKGVQLHNPPVLQWRYKRRGEEGAMGWSEWQDVPYVREGDEDNPIVPPRSAA